MSEIRVSKIRVSKIRGSKIRGSEIRVSEIRISSNHRELRGAIFWIGWSSVELFFGLVGGPRSDHLSSRGRGGLLNFFLQNTSPLSCHNGEKTSPGTGVQLHPPSTRDQPQLWILVPCFWSFSVGLNVQRPERPQNTTMFTQSAQISRNNVHWTADIRSPFPERMACATEILSRSRLTGLHVGKLLDVSCAKAIPARHSQIPNFTGTDGPAILSVLRFCLFFTRILRFSQKRVHNPRNERKFGF